MRKRVANFDWETPCRSDESKEYRQGAGDAQEQSVVRVADHLADLREGDDRDLVDGDLRRLAKAVSGVGDTSRRNWSASGRRVVVSGQITVDGKGEKRSL
jgi:hypothetical protein